MNNLSPKVSVVIPTCDRPKLLKRAIDSVLGQTFSDFELIVVDDGIKEKAEAWIKTLSDPRVHYLVSGGRGGSAARNMGIKSAKGTYVAFLDDDDIWVPDKLEKQVTLLGSLPSNVGFCFGAVKRDLGNGREEITSVPEGVGDYFGRALTRFAGILTITLVVKKEVFDKVGGFDESLPSHQEAELMIRIAEKYKGIGINEPLAVVRETPGHLQLGKDLKKRIRGREIILAKHSNLFCQRPKIYAKHLFGLAILYRDAGDRVMARANFKKALAMHFSFRYFVHYITMMPWISH